MVVEAPHPQQILLQRADEAFRDAVAFGLPHEARGTFDAEERHLLLKVVGQSSSTRGRDAKPQPAGHALADRAEAGADALADRLQGLKAGPALGRMQADALGRAVVERPRRRRPRPRPRSLWPSCPCPTSHRGPRW